MQIYYLILYFFTYGFLGWCTEVAFASVKERRFVNRGFLNGPICPIYGVGVSAVVFLLEPFKDSLLLLYVSSVVVVTLIEGVTGYAMDKVFHHKWWDYSDQPLNIGGYVCLVFSLVWGIACVAIMKLIHPLIHSALSFLPFVMGMILIIILGIVLFADLYVTAATILKLNRHLETMEKIAAELHELSEKVGSNIHENVMDTIEKQEEGKKKLEEGKKKLEELKEKYTELTRKGSKVGKRLLKAFPKMESRRHKDILNELRSSLEDRFRKS